MKNKSPSPDLKSIAKELKSRLRKARESDSLVEFEKNITSINALLQINQSQAVDAIIQYNLFKEIDGLPSLKKYSGTKNYIASVLWQTMFTVLPIEKQRLLLTKIKKTTGTTLLHRALIKRNQPLFISILKFCVDILSFDELHSILTDNNNYGYTLLGSAVHNATYDTIKLLLDHLANDKEALSKNLTTQTYNGFTPLVSAIKTGNYKIFKLIMICLTKDQEALSQNLLTSNKDKFMPLDNALMSGNYKIVALFMKHLVKNKVAFAQNLANRTQGGFMPLQTALNTNNYEIVELFLQYLNQDKVALTKNLINKNDENFMPIQSAMKTGNDKIFKLFMEYLEKDDNALSQNLLNCTSAGFMPIQSALNSGNCEILTRLFEYLKLNTDALTRNLTNKTIDGILPLQIAINTSNIEIVKLFIGHLNEHKIALKMNFANCSAKGFMPFNSAVKTGNSEIVAFLLEQLAKYPSILKDNLQKRTTTWFTPLKQAFVGKNEVIIKILLKEIIKHKTICMNQIKIIDPSGFNFFDSVLICQSTNNFRLFLMLISYLYKDNAKDEFKKLYHQAKLFGRLREGETLTLTNEALAGNFPALDELFNFNSTSPFAGINPKYLDPNPIKKPHFVADANNTIAYKQSHECKKLPFTDVSTPLKSYLIQTKCLKADLYTTADNIDKRDKVTFICAGRKENALVPSPHIGRCMWVCTENELQHLKAIKLNFIHVDLLVIKNITTAYGNSSDLGLLTNRRLAIFLAANYWQLDHFMMMDDNIKQVQFTSPTHLKSYTNSWDGFYNTLLDSLESEPCLSVTRHYDVPAKTGQLGSKLFMLDMKSIRTRFPTEKALTMLFPQPAQATFWGEDYYFQLVLHFAFRDINQGYRVLDKEIAVLIRATQHANAFALGSGRRILAEHYPQPEAVDSVKQFEWVKNAITHLNTIIDDNQTSYQKNKLLQPSNVCYDETTATKCKAGLINVTATELMRISKPRSNTAPSTSNQNIDIPSKKVDVNPIMARVPSIEGPVSLSFDSQHEAKLKNASIICNPSEINPQTHQSLPPIAPHHFYEALLDSIKGMSGQHLRDYQHDSIMNIKLANPLKIASIIKAASTGKTRTQSALACLGYSHLLAGEHIVIVTKDTALVSQFVANLRENRLPYHVDLEHKNIPDNAIIPVSYQHFSLEKLFDTDSFREPKVFIFCIDSLMNLIESHPNILERIKLLMLDEYHAYQTHAERIYELRKSLSDHLTLGFTATPPKNNPYKVIYHYSLTQAINEAVVAPIIADCLPLPSNSSVDEFLNNIPNIILNRYHPGFKDSARLVDMKGIIFLNRTEQCDSLQKLLAKANISSFAIHSDNANYKTDLEAFKQSNNGIIITCKMCTIGFDDKDIGYVLLTTKPEKNSLEQMICRATRRNGDKIAYVISIFQSVHHDIMELVKKQKLNLAVDCDYLGLDYNDNVYDTEDLPKQETPILPFGCSLTDQPTPTIDRLTQLLMTDNLTKEKSNSDLTSFKQFTPMLADDDNHIIIPEFFGALECIHNEIKALKSLGRSVAINKRRINDDDENQSSNGQSTGTGFKKQLLFHSKRPQLRQSSIGIFNDEDDFDSIPRFIKRGNIPKKSKTEKQTNNLSNASRKPNNSENISRPTSLRWHAQ